MKKTLCILSTLSMALLLAGCGPDSVLSKRNVGAVTGGALGGAIGSQIGSGTGKTIATVAGTLLGAGLGGAIGSSMDDVDRMKMNQALETAPANQPVQWQSQRGNQYTVTPSATYRNAQGVDCRKFTTMANINGKQQEVKGTACRNPNGSWHIVN